MMEDSMVTVTRLSEGRIWPSMVKSRSSCVTVPESYIHSSPVSCGWTEKRRLLRSLGNVAR